MRRSIISLFLLATIAATAAITTAGCGFGRADDTGLPVPGHYWGWVCPSGDAPHADAGCPAADGGARDGAAPADGPAADR
jgi:hypothetical protein